MVPPHLRSRPEACQQVDVDPILMCGRYTVRRAGIVHGFGALYPPSSSRCCVWNHRRLCLVRVASTRERHSPSHCTGTSIGAPLSLTKMTTIFAGLVVLAFRPTVCTSSGPS